MPPISLTQQSYASRGKRWPKISCMTRVSNQMCTLVTPSSPYANVLNFVQHCAKDSLSDEFFFQLRKVLSHAFRLFADKMHKAGATVLILRKNGRATIRDGSG